MDMSKWSSEQCKRITHVKTLHLHNYEKLFNVSGTWLGTLSVTIQVVGIFFQVSNHLFYDTYCTWPCSDTLKNLSTITKSLKI